MKKHLSLLILLFVGHDIQAQIDNHISGTVVDEKMQPLNGAVVQ